MGDWGCSQTKASSLTNHKLVIVASLNIELLACRFAVCTCLPCRLLFVGPHLVQIVYSIAQGDDIVNSDIIQ
jgi:hypothetical protein